MSAERYRVTEYQHSGLDFLQIERGGSTHELCAQTDDSMIVGAIRQQSADIAELRAELVAALKDLLDDVCEREDVDSPSCNPGRQNAVKWARAALAKAGWQ